MASNPELLNGRQLDLVLHDFAIISKIKLLEFINAIVSRAIAATGESDIFTTPTLHLKDGQILVYFDDLIAEILQSCGNELIGMRSIDTGGKPCKASTEVHVSSDIKAQVQPSVASHSPSFNERVRRMFSNNTPKKMPSVHLRVITPLITEEAGGIMVKFRLELVEVNADTKLIVARSNRYLDKKVSD